MRDQRKIVDGKEKPLILFSCLDWGLGHTTRSIPIMKEFLANGCDLIVACNSIQKKILHPELPAATFVDLQGYDITYGNAKWSTKFKILLQARKILTRINRENHWLSAFLMENQPDAVISDNRYGLVTPKIPSVFITHQLAPKTGFGSVADKILRNILYKRINRFNECWVPDFQKQISLAGDLSHPNTFPSNKVKYIGALSRFSSCHSTGEIAEGTQLLVLLSGPEPQRTIFEKTLIDQLTGTKMNVVFIRGVPGETEMPTAFKEIRKGTFYNHLDAASLTQEICKAQLVISRSGYTTVMDLLKLKKKMILVPTPGQPEQEYLSRWLGKNQLALCYDQKRFSIEKAIKGAITYPFKPFDRDMNEYKLTVKKFVERISSLSPSLTN